MHLLKNIVLIIFIAFVLAVVFFITPPSNREDMIKKYSNQHSKFITGSNGLEIHYRDQGRDDGPPLVLVHGNSISLHFFTPLVDQLDSQFRLISYDQPGHGLTGPTEDQHYDYQVFAQALDDIIDKLDLKQMVLVGHSLGGWVSWRYASEHPERIAALVLLTASGSPPLENNTQSNSGIGFRIAQTSIGRFLSRFISPRFMFEQSNKQAIYNDALVDDQLVDMTWELLRFPGNQTAFAKRAAMSREIELFEKSKQIAAPTLLIWGSKDTFIPAATAISFETNIPVTEKVLLEDVGHLPMYEAPAQVADLIGGFVTRHWKNWNISLSNFLVSKFASNLD